MQLFSRIGRVVDTLFTKHLFITNTTVGILFLGAGDCIQQNIEMRLYPGKVYEAKRTGNLMIAGSVLGVLGHFWYKLLDSKFPLRTRSHVVKKLLAEMAIGPPFMLSFFLGAGYLEGKPPERSFQEFKKNIITILIADWAIYVPMQALNFFYVPPRFRLLYVCSLCLGYDVFVSYILHKEDNKKLKSAKCNEREESDKLR